MHTPGFRRFAFFSPFVLLAVTSLDAQQPSRIAGRLDNGRRVALAGRVHRNARQQNDLGRVDPRFQLPAVTVFLKPSAPGQASLNQLLQDQQDPASPNFHHWLTPEEYADRFGASQIDITQISDWLKAQGLTVSSVARGRNAITVTGTADAVQNAFHTEIHRYQVDGITHFANATDPSVPAAIASMVAGITGLHDFHLKPRLRKPSPDMTTGGTHHLAPDDIATIYNVAPLYSAGVDGTGQKIAVVGQTAIRTSDIDQFRTKFNLPPINLVQKLVSARNNPGIVDGDVDEAHLDIEWASAVARNATIVYVYSPDVWTSAQYAVNNNVAPVITMSYGACEQSDLGNLTTYRQIAQQANAQGITWFAASGDSGAGDCEDRGAATAQNGFAVDSPSSIPEITGMGGTMFDEQGGAYWNSANNVNGASAQGYIPERVWNESSLGELSSGGGGASVAFSQPSWQTGPGVPNDGKRHVPDLSLSSAASHDGYYVYSGGATYFGGTSVAAPIMAGVAALLNQYLVSTGAAQQAGLGNMNPTLYRLAQTTTNVFHDIVNGDNSVPCIAATPDCVNGSFGQKAGPSYDMATGLGSIDAANLVHQWSNHPAITSAVVPSVNQSPVFQTGGAWTFAVTLTEEAGIGTKVTDFTIDGVSHAADIPTLFKTAAIQPRGSITANLTLTGLAVPKNVVLAFNGVDATGATWSTQMSVPFQGPQIHLTAGGLSNAASGQQVYAPGMILSVYGAGMANFAQAAGAIPLPQYLAGFEATINDVPAPLYYVSPTQVNVQIPYETATGPATLVLGNPFENVTYHFTVASTGPGIFTFADGSVNPSRTAKHGDVATLFITGEGAVRPSLATGTTPSSTTPLSRLPSPQAGQPTVTVGGIAAQVQFAGIPSGLVGVTQINFTIPAGVASGVQPVVVTVGNASSNTATITVQ
jgi:uncharacterized protein (TIGR03437 family)